jgi:hypothetical protein
MPGYAIKCEPGGYLRDDASGRVIYFATRAEAATEAVRLTQDADNNPRVAGTEFTVVPMPGNGGEVS